MPLDDLRAEPHDLAGLREVAGGEFLFLVVGEQQPILAALLPFLVIVVAFKGLELVHKFFVLSRRK